ncbi:hypothetical protein SDRG_10959 [Saprolegnia diclina VS20]|uniref:Bud22 domain-containing protein n=1 Tax=Saprolegnia diclina (strain VS20) TaxID=1156394 RepID=T0RN18_SAPDV|nr:hypothetical protein SDRG_10959 [Saprolegnia diclina VS20]EQC31357.1 hypothetical protein SDRG_10959 [Saprolegnia diclina VS20]|eukprot:XP_008615198.1 hypothetical protein SDRG_10959 [Saprolegnia diclina VS20]
MAGSSAKRKREYSEDEKLSHQASVAFARELKKIKTFELQKVIKVLGKDPENPALQIQVELLKNLDISLVVRRALLSLGLDPPAKQAKAVELPDELAAKIKAIETSLLKHKRLAPVMKTWKEKTGERAEKLFKEENAELNKSRGKNGLGARSSAAPVSLFVGTLSGFGDADDRAKEEDVIADFLGEKHKKNRPGQRARKQKALMIEAAKTGRPIESGGSFREKKERPKPAKKANKPPAAKPAKPARVERTRPEAPAVDKTSHPSWAAKQAQKDKEKVDIHAFSGKKVVFDD